METTARTNDYYKHVLELYSKLTYPGSWIKNRVEGICRNPYMMGIVIAGMQIYLQNVLTRTNPRGGGTSSSSGLNVSLK
jgi:hypothetical protein